MAKNKQQKEEIVVDLTKRLKEAKGVVFGSYIGLKVVELEELRKTLRAQKADLMVAKKTLLKRALESSDLKDVKVENMEGGVIVATGADEVQPAKVMQAFSKKHAPVKFFGGIMEKKWIDVEKVNALAALPSKEELLAKIVGSLNAPVSGFVRVLSGNLRGLVQALNAIKEKKA
ncbi:MAG: 50S ribosomal protein L10 [Patescibacteria group bacterium]|jgi:large subunit ribosomal protein L10